MKRMMMWAACLATTGAFAYDWAAITEDGVATVPAGETAAIADAADVTAVQALDEIVFADSAATVLYTASAPLNLTARLTGAGAFVADSSAKLAILGDNSGLVAPGHFDFTNSPVVVSNHYGLGTAASGPTYVKFNANGSLDFGCASGHFTNEVALTLANDTSLYTIILGSSSLSEYFVQSNDVTVVGGGNGGARTYLRNNCEFIAGTFKNTSNLLYTYVTGVTPAKSVVRFSGTCLVKPASWWFFYGNSGMTYFFDSSVALGSNSGTIFPGQGGGGCGMTLGVDDYFKGVGVGMDQNSVLDLNGHSTDIALFHNQYWKPTAGQSAYCVIRSATKARVRKTGTGKSDTAFAPCFEGLAGYCHDANEPNSFINIRSTSLGLLDIAKNTFTLASNAGWAGDVTIRDNATLVLDSQYAMYGGKGALKLEGTGKLSVTANADVSTKSITFDHTETGAETTITEAGKYTLANLRSRGCNVEGDDALVISVVEDTSGEWTGWPETPGANVLVPDNCTAFIYDSDVWKVEQCASVKLGSGARVICSNLTERLDLTAPVSGLGYFQAFDSAGVVLLGDNSKLTSPGCFFFSNSYVVVSNRYGLGSTKTDPMTFWYGDKSESLDFGGAGLTNDVAINLYQGTDNTGMVIGSRVKGEELVLNNGLNVRTETTNGRRLLYRNAVRLAGGALSSTTPDGKGTWHLFMGPANNALDDNFYIDENARVANLTYFFWYEGLLHLKGTASITFAPCGSGRCVCERTDALKGFSSFLPFAYALFDLNGFDQTLCGSWYDSYDSTHVGSTITSAAPATVTMDMAANNKTYALRFRGKAALTFNKADCLNTICKLFSDTVGPLVVAKGTLAFSEGAGWGGTNVTVKSGATLRVADATSAATAFGKKTDIVIDDGGTLNLVSSGTVTCRSLTYNGQPVPPGTYAAGSYGITGSGSLVVRRYPGVAGLRFIVR